MSVTGDSDDNNIQICWQLWLGISCGLFPQRSLVTRGMQSVQSLWSLSFLGWMSSPLPPPSCTMTKLSGVSSVLTPKCKDLMLYWETGNHSCQLQEGLYREPSKWGGRSFYPAQFLVIIPLSYCRTQHWGLCTRCDKEITSSRGHSMGVGSLWFPSRKLQSIGGGFVKQGSARERLAQEG